MKRNDAKKIAQTIPNEQLKQMFDSAKSQIKDWTKVSSVDKGMTKGAVWNISAKDFDVNKRYHHLTKINMVREFGEFLPDELKISKKEKKSLPNPVHQEPRF